MVKVRQSSGFQRVEWNTAFRVPLTTLDQLISRYESPTFCKLDIEEHELEALQGLSSAIQVISFEFLTVTIGLAAACVERLEELGRYEYSWSVAEKHQLQTEYWLSAAEMIAWLSQLADSGKSGDIYARLSC